MFHVKHDTIRFSVYIKFAALYELCAAPSLRTTHFALRTQNSSVNIAIKAVLPPLLPPQPLLHQDSAQPRKSSSLHKFLHIWQAL